MYAVTSLALFHSSSSPRAHIDALVPVVHVETDAGVQINLRDPHTDQQKAFTPVSGLISYGTYLVNLSQLCPFPVSVASALFFMI